MIIARFLAVCGEGTHNYGIFDNKEILKKDYKRIKYIIEHGEPDVEGNEARKCYFRNINANTIFNFDGSKFILVKPKGINYEIDFEEHMFGETYKMAICY